MEPLYKERILNIICSLVLKIFLDDSEKHEVIVNSLKENILPVLGQSLRDWLSKGKIKLDKDSANKFKALTFAAKSNRY